MGRKSGITSGGYHPQIFKMQTVMAAREWNREQEHLMINKKKMRYGYWRQRLSNAMGELKFADAQGWERWFEDEANVPAEASDREYAMLAEARVTELRGSFPAYKCVARRDIFIWQDAIGYFVYSKEDGKKELYTHEFETFEAAESFIRGLTTSNCGYGFVIDLLPVSLLSHLLEKKNKAKA